MTTTVIHDRQLLQDMFCRLADDAEEISLVSVRITSASGGARGVWNALHANLHKVRQVVTAVEHSDPTALTALHCASVLRRANAGPGGLRTTVALFRQNGRATALVSSAPFPFHGFGTAVDIAVRIDGEAIDPNIAEIELLLRDARRHAWVPYLRELDVQPDEEVDEMETSVATGRSLAKVATSALDKLQFVREPGRVAELRTQFVAEFLAGATTVEAQLGVRGSTIDTQVHWHPQYGVWGSFSEVDNRYVHSFGTRDPDSGNALSIAVQVNVPREGVNARIAGDFVEEPKSRSCFLAHRGRIGGVRGIGKAGFWQSARLASALADRGDGVEAKVALVCEIGSPRFVENLAAFVHEVERLKSELAEEVEELEDGDEADSDELDGDDWDEETPDFLALADRGEQTLQVWLRLLGYGDLEKDAAVREAAKLLRDEGLVDYSRLAEKGELYQAILAAIEGGVRDGGFFDRPRRGFVRAVLTSPEAYPPVVWEECVRMGLPDDEFVAREDAVRLAADWAKETFGLEYERIRRNGKIDAGVRGALRVLIRRGDVVAEGRELVMLLGEEE